MKNVDEQLKETREDLRITLLALRRVAGADPTKFMQTDPVNVKPKSLGVVKANDHMREVANVALDTILERQYSRGDEVAL